MTVPQLNERQQIWREQAAKQIRDPAWKGGSCINLTERGCSLQFEKRPLECRALVPNEKEPGKWKMTKGVNKQALSIAWIPYHEVILAAEKQVKEEKDNE